LGSPEGVGAEVRLAANPGRNRIALYMPYAREITLDFDLNGCELLLIDLEQRRINRARCRIDRQGTKILLPDFNADALFLAVG
jgi:hypothetical protein